MGSNFPIVIPGGKTYTLGVYYPSLNGNAADNFIPEYPSSSFILNTPLSSFGQGYIGIGDTYPKNPYNPPPLYNSVFGPNISLIEEEVLNPLQIIKQATTLTPLTGIGYSNNIKRNPLTSGITSVPADGSAYFGPMIFVEVNN